MKQGLATHRAGPCCAINATQITVRGSLLLKHRIVALRGVCSVQSRSDRGRDAISTLGPRGICWAGDGFRGAAVGFFGAWSDVKA